MVGCHYRLKGRGFGWTPGVGDVQGGLVCCSSWSRKELEMTEGLNNNNNTLATNDHSNRERGIHYPSGIYGSDSKESAYSAGDLGLIPGWGRSSGEGNGYPLQYSCLEKSMDKGAWLATVHGLQRVGRD